MKDGFVRVGSVSPQVRVADVDFNVEQIIKHCAEADEKSCSLLVFPELSITGYTCGDLFLQDELIESALRGLYDIAEATCEMNLAIVVGLPLKFEGKLYNVAAVVAKECDGAIIVVSSGTVSYKAVQRTKAQIENIGIKNEILALIADGRARTAKEISWRWQP